MFSSLKTTPGVANQVEKRYIKQKTPTHRAQASIKPLAMLQHPIQMVMGPAMMHNL
jgi:hypothetical protein